MFSVKNDVQGIGQRIYSNNSSFGSAGKLQGVISFMGFFPLPEFIDILASGVPTSVTVRSCTSSCIDGETSWCQ